MQQATADYIQLADPDLFNERRHLREKIADLPASHPGRARLTATLDAMTDELDRRARAAWQAAKPCPAGNPTAPPPL